MFSEMFCSISDYKFLLSFLEKNWTFVSSLLSGTVVVSNVWKHAYSHSKVEDIEAAFQNLSESERTLMFAAKLELTERTAVKLAWEARDDSAVSSWLDQQKGIN